MMAPYNTTSHTHARTRPPAPIYLRQLPGAPGRRYLGLGVEAQLVHTQALRHTACVCGGGEGGKTRRVDELVGRWGLMVAAESQRPERNACAPAVHHPRTLSHHQQLPANNLVILPA